MLVLGLLIYGVWILVAYLNVSRLVLLPTRLPETYPFQFDQAFQEVWLTDAKGEVHALYFPSSTEEVKGLILYFHGNADDLQRWGKHAGDFTGRGYDILMVDYPGFGKSVGKPSEQGLYRAAELAYSWAESRYEKEEIILYGRSMGSGPASYLATHHEAKSLMLETPFYSINDITHKRFPILFPMEIPFKVPVYENLANRTMEKAYIFQGTDDRIVPLSSAERLKPFLKTSDDFFLIPGGQHKNLARFDEYQTALDSLL
ncbi:MAG: alpha/beta hydrolase [Bacteroidota bacterium]